MITIKKNSETMLEADGKILNRPRKSKGKTYDTLYIYLPVLLTHDSQWPFLPDQKIRIKIVGDHLVIEKKEK